MTRNPHEEDKPSQVFDFETAEYYPDAPLVDDVIWPLVDHFAQTDLRGRVFSASPFEYNGSGTLDDREYRVKLLAESCLTPGQDELRIENYAQLVIEELATGRQRDMLLDAVKSDVISIHGSLDASDKDGDIVWPNGAEPLFNVYSGQNYLFDQTSLVDRAFSSVIEGTPERDGSRMEVYHVFETCDRSIGEDIETVDPDKLEPIRLLLAHMVAIEDSCKILKAPETILRELEKQKAEPTTY